MKKNQMTTYLKRFYCSTCAAIFALSACLVFAVFSRVCAQPRIWQDDESIYIESECFRYVLGKDGINKAFIDKRTGTDYLEHEKTSRLFHVIKNNLSYGSTGVKYEDSLLTVRLSNSNVTAKCRVEAYEGYFTLELVEARTRGINKFIMLDIPVTLSEHVGGIINVCHNDEFGIGALSLNLKTRCRLAQTDPPVFEASGVAETGGIIGLKAAVFAVPADSILSTIGRIEQEQDLPHPKVGGTWGKISPEVKKPYLEAECSERDIKQVIQYAKEGGFEYIVIDMDSWAESVGTYAVNTAHFPHGIYGLRSVVSEIHSAGLKAGTRFFIGCIGKDDPYASPKPDPRLYKHRSRVLAHSVSPEDSVVYITYSIEQFPSGYPFTPREMDIQIDDEIFIYSNLLLNKLNPGFSGCFRGAHGTKAAAHKRRTKLYHLAERRNHYIIDVNTDLSEEIAERIAEVVNVAGFDMALLDGEEFLSVQEPAWYYAAMVLNAVCSKFQRDVLIQSNVVPHFGWHYISRLGIGEMCYDDRKRVVERSVRNITGKAADNFLPAEIGTMGLTLNKQVSNTLEDIEAFGIKGIAFDTPWSLKFGMDVMNGFGQIHQVLDLVRIYGELQGRNYFSDDVKSRLRKPGACYTLRKQRLNIWNFSPVSYETKHIKCSPQGERAEWIIYNSWGSQPIRLRITALPFPADYENPENVLLADFRPGGNFRLISEPFQFTTLLASSKERVKSGTYSGKLTGYNRRTSPLFQADPGGYSGSRSSWAAQTMRFPVPLDLSSHRAFGIWIFGDKSNALLDIELHDDQWMSSRDFPVRLDFNGWKYFEFVNSAGAGQNEYQLTGRPSPIYRDFRYGKVTALSILIDDVPPASRIIVYLSPIKALKLFSSPVVNPTVTIGNRSVTFPVTLETGFYLEYTGDGLAKVFSPEGRAVASFRLKGEPLLLNHGDNEIAFTCRSGSGIPTLCRITVRTVSLTHAFNKKTGEEN